MTYRTSSRLIARLNGAIVAAADSVAADCCRAEIACHFARSGHWAEMQSIIDDLHQRHQRRPSPEVVCWLNLAEGLAIFFRDMGPGALDKIRRSYALSEAYGLRPPQARASAWLAHIAYGRHQFAEMAKNLTAAISLTEAGEYSTLSRVCLIAAQAIHLADREDLADPWYALARNHAVADGDELTISAIQFNRFSIRSANMRNAELSSAPLGSKCNSVLIGTESLENLDALIGVRSQSVFIPLIRAQALASEERYSEALVLYEKYSPACEEQGLARLRCWFHADMAWCYARQGNEGAARVRIDLSTECSDGSAHTDDLAATHSRISQTLSLLGDNGGASRHQAIANVLWREFDSMQKGWLVLVEGLDDLYMAKFGD